jgi:acetyl-CoA synthetase
MTPGSVIWNPADHAWTADSRLARFMRRHGFEDFDSLWRRSAVDPEWFWRSALEDLGVHWRTPPTKILDASEGLPWARWFPGGRINITDNCIERHVRAGHGGEIALIYETDSGAPEEARKLNFAELAALVDRCAAALDAAGIGPGDAVGLYAPLHPETVAVMFATFKIGARFVPIFCGFGAQAVIDRLESCGARILFANRHLRRRGRAIPTAEVLDSARAALPLLEKVVHVDTGEWPQFLTTGDGRQAPAADTAAEDRCMLIYTSGTTGKPKGTVHTHAGVLAQVAKEVGYAFDAQPGRPFFWYTDIGWMMGPWELIGALFFRAPVVLLDGVPNWPDSGRLWRIIATHRVDILGIAPTGVRLLMQHGPGEGPENYNLSSLRVLGSTGEPWDDRSYDWFFRRVGGGRCPIMNISGGTELMGCLLQPYPVTPLKALTLGRGALGMDVDVFNDEGQSVRGKVGHLVCKRPAPSMTKSFLNDDARYLETYFERFGPGVWCHGDWASIDADGYWFLHGRTDDTLKVAGKRIGPAEIESTLIEHPAVKEAAAIGVPDELKGQVIVCLAVTTAEVTEGELIRHLAIRMGKPLAPKRVHQVAALPKTRSGKIVRGVIKRAYCGESPGDLSSVENRDAVAAIVELRHTPKP